MPIAKRVQTPAAVGATRLFELSASTFQRQYQHVKNHPDCLAVPPKRRRDPRITASRVEDANEYQRQRQYVKNHRDCLAVPPKRHRGPRIIVSHDTLDSYTFHGSLCNDLTRLSLPVARYRPPFLGSMSELELKSQLAKMLKICE
jgi:hypothetical protein